MYDLLAIVAGLALGIGFLVLVASLLERRARSQGPLFTRPPTAIGRVFSIAFALFFAGAFVAELLFADRYHVVFPILAIALFAYGVGAYRFLVGIQRTTDEAPPKDRQI
jgi:hypothetical protein